MTQESDLTWVLSRTPCARGRCGPGMCGYAVLVTALVAIVCDGCGDVGMPVGSTPPEARAGLKGWVRRNGRDMCPLCRIVTEARR
jgi:hypothetical protein